MRGVFLENEGWLLSPINHPSRTAFAVDDTALLIRVRCQRRLTTSSSTKPVRNFKKTRLHLKLLDSISLNDSKRLNLCANTLMEKKIISRNWKKEDQAIVVYIDY